MRDTQGKDAPRVAAMFDFLAGLPDKIRGETVPVPAPLFNYTRRESYGVGAAITSWNFPLPQVATKVAPILACGNAVVRFARSPSPGARPSGESCCSTRAAI